MVKGQGGGHGLSKFQSTSQPRRRIASTQTNYVMLQYALLWIFHLILALKRFVATLLPKRQPRPLRTRRRKLPGHLAVILRHDKSSGKSNNELPEALESVRRLALWCRIAGIRVLSVFDEEGKSI